MGVAHAPPRTTVRSDSAHTDVRPTVLRSTSASLLPVTEGGGHVARGARGILTPTCISTIRRGKRRATCHLGLDQRARTLPRGCRLPTRGVPLRHRPGGRRRYRGPEDGRVTTDRRPGAAMAMGRL